MTRELAAHFVFLPPWLVRAREVLASPISEVTRVGDVRAGEQLTPELNRAHRLGLDRTSLRDATKVPARAGVPSVRLGSSDGIFVVYARGGLRGKCSLEQVGHRL